MGNLRNVLHTHVDSGSIPGAVGLVAHGDTIEVEAVGSVDVGGSRAMARDSIFRIASITKPITAAAVLMLVDDGRIALDDAIDRWLPELAAPMVARTPGSAIDDVVPADRPITVFDLMTFRAGYGFPSDFSLPALGPLFSDLKQGPPAPQDVAAPDDWMATLSSIPMVSQPGESWLYNTCSDVLGVLVARVAGVSLAEFLSERLFVPLGMVDTGFSVPPAKLNRFATYYRHGASGQLELADAADGQWSAMPAFASGAGGLVSTADDWLAFGRMLLADGAVGNHRLLSHESVQQMTTDHLTQSQRDASTLFLEGQGWGFGGSVDVATIDPWNAPGRYGWIGGTGTSAHICKATGTVEILLTQVEMSGPTAPEVMRDFWTYSAGGCET